MIVALSISGLIAVALGFMIWNFRKEVPYPSFKDSMTIAFFFVMGLLCIALVWIVYLMVTR